MCEIVQKYYFVDTVAVHEGEIISALKGLNHIR